MGILPVAPCSQPAIQPVAPAQVHLDRLVRKSPRIAVAGILHESNTFSLKLTHLRDFEDGATCRGSQVEREFGEASHEIGGFFEGGREFGLDLVPTLVANATPSGTVADNAFEALVDELVDRVSQAGRIDGLLLALHGALVAQSYPAADAEVLRRVRLALGPALPIVSTHDAHANVAPEEIDLATALVIYKEVPHVDQRACGKRAAWIMSRIAGEGLRPAQAIVKPPLLYSIVYHNTTKRPMLPLVEELKRLEGEDERILAANAAVGYQYADVPHMGPSIVVVTDGDRRLARREAKRLGNLMWNHRLAMTDSIPDAAEGVRLAIEATRKPAVLVDLGDNIGGGSAGDGTTLLKELIGQDGPAFVVPLFDPEAVAEAFRAGVGGRFSLAVGGKTDNLHGEPVPIAGTVKLIYDGKYMEAAARHGGMRYLDQGLTAVIELDDAVAGEPSFVLVNSKRHPPFSLGQLTSAGIQPERQEVLVVKAAVAFRAAYEAVAGKIIEVDTPGLTAVNPKRLSYERARADLFLPGAPVHR